MKKLLAILIFLISNLIANENINHQIDKKKSTNFFHINMGVSPLPYPCPALGIGYRIQKNRFGADISLKASSLLLASFIQAELAAIYYFNTNEKSQYYTGIGSIAILDGSGDNLHARGDNSVHYGPEFITGIQYKNKNNKNRFIEARIGYLLSYKNYSRTYPSPVIGSLTYGIGF